MWCPSDCLEHYNSYCVYILTLQVVLELVPGDQLPTLSLALLRATTRSPLKSWLPDSVTAWAITCVIYQRKNTYGSHGTDSKTLDPVVYITPHLHGNVFACICNFLVAFEPSVYKKIIWKTNVFKDGFQSSLAS